MSKLLNNIKEGLAFFILLTLALMAIVGAVVIFGIAVASAEPANDCQYPQRPLVAGQCNNSDPAVPECIKDEANCAADIPAATPAPEQATTTTLSEQVRKCTE